ncbi:MAG: cation diffusion facilitator family transporter [Polyangiaceae bacterium]
MASSESTKSVVAALAGNVFVTLIKFLAFAISGSGAMLSEAIHSAADTGNQLLLFIGLRRARREGDDDFHYGYGGERFVFGLLSAAGIFFVGCGVTIYHGVHSLMHPTLPHVGFVTFAVLGASFLIEGSVLLFAIRSINTQRGKTPFFRFVRQGADPATLAILLEDGVAVSGVLIAAIGVAAGYFLRVPEFDAVASILIGLLLGFIAIYLVIENRKLLLGRAVPEGVEERFVDILERWPSVISVHDVKTQQLTPETYRLKAEVRFKATHFASLIASSTGGMGEVPLTALVARTIRLVSDDIDAMERAVKEAIPQARYIDIEIEQTPPPEDDEGLPMPVSQRS